MEVDIDSIRVTQLDAVHVGILARNNAMHMYSNSAEAEPKEMYRVADVRALPHMQQH